LQLSRKAGADADFRPVGTMTMGADGAARFRVLPRQTTTYRVDYAGDTAQWLPASAEAVVSVRPRIGLTATEMVYRGQRARLSITVGPAHPGGAVVVRQRRDGAWSDWRTVTLDERSRATLRWRASTVGRQSFRVRMAADAEHADGASVVRRVTVRKPNPYGVPVTLRRIIVVDKSQYRLYFFSHGREVKSFPCVLGRPSLPTPTGRFRIYAKGMWPGGPFGARIMSYHSPYAIHGTNEPHLLNRFPRNFSHGCTRLGNANAIWLYDHAPVGTPVWNVP
jgi:lipoprotein-anchoring transpeptidase ErfK/SrfK